MAARERPVRLLEPGGAGWPARRGRSPGAAAVPTLVAISAGIAVAVLFAFLRPQRQSAAVAVTAGLVLCRYAALALFFRRAVRLTRAEEAVAADPTRAELYFELAEARLRGGRVHEAVRAFRQGVGLHLELDLDRPAELGERLLARAGKSAARRKITVYLITAALFDRMLEDIELLEVDRDETPEAWSAGDVARRLEGSARETFLEHCKGLVESLHVEIAGLEQLVVALEGGGEHLASTRTEQERQRRRLLREIERLRTHAGEIDSVIRHARERRNDTG